LRNVLETFPRDEIFEMSRDELAEAALTIVGLQERSLIRVIALTPAHNGWQTLAVYLPRSRVTPETPNRVARHIAHALHADGWSSTRS
jgi:glutamate dehydrogenase